MNNEKIYVTKPFLPPMENYVDYLKKIWETHILTNSGPLYKEFVEKMRQISGTNVLLTTNGHLALESAIRSLDLPAGGEVITTPFTFVSTTNAIVNCGLKPVFCDIKLDDYTIDEEQIVRLITDKTCLILPVHVYGYPCNVDAIDRIAKEHNLKVIYDAAHAFYVKYQDTPLVNCGDISMISFHATKLFHTIEGGLLVSKDEKLLKRIETYINFGITGPETTEQIGINAKMNEFQAAMGLSLAPYIDEIIGKRKQIYLRYEEILKQINGIRITNLKENIIYNYAYFPILIDEVGYGMNRDDVFNLLAENNIYSRKYFAPLVTEFEIYKDQYNNNNLMTAKYVSDRILTLPIYPDLSLEDVDYICKILLNKRRDNTR